MNVRKTKQQLKRTTLMAMNLEDAVYETARLLRLAGEADMAHAVHTAYTWLHADRSLLGEFEHLMTQALVTLDSLHCYTDYIAEAFGREFGWDDTHPEDTVGYEIYARDLVRTFNNYPL